MPDTQRTLILVKPDAFERRLTGEIIRRFEAKGLSIVAAKHMTTERDLAEEHYAEHKDKPFFGAVGAIAGAAIVIAGQVIEDGWSVLIGLVALAALLQPKIKITEPVLVAAAAVV